METKIPLLVFEHQDKLEERQRSSIARTFLTIFSASLFVAQATLIKYFDIHYLDAFLVQCLMQVFVYGLYLLFTDSPAMMMNENGNNLSFFMILTQVRKMTKKS